MRLNSKEYSIFKSILNDLVSSRSLLPRYLGKVDSELEIEDWSDYCFASWIYEGQLIIATNYELLENKIKSASKGLHNHIKESTINNISKALRVFTTGEFLKLLVEYEPEISQLKSHKFV